jgi:hypothetical protein
MIVFLSKAIQGQTAGWPINNELERIGKYELMA